MKKQLLKLLLLWMLLSVPIAAFAADWPATLYMEQSSFSTSGRVSAAGSDGVYEFDLTYPASNTTVPRYYIFSSATTQTNAKKGTYKIYGASSIADATTVQPVDGQSYPLADLSSADDAKALIEGATICSFLPVYCNGASFRVTVNLGEMSVVFRRDPAEDDVSTLGIFTKSASKALASADVDRDGKARYSIRVNTDTNVYFAANTATRSETNKTAIWGATSQVSPDNITVTAGQTCPLQRTTYYQVYTAEKCCFTIPAGAYDIVADINSGTVEFADYTGRYRAKPATLYMRSYTFGTSYGSAAGDNGVYTFTFDKSASTTTAPFCAVFTEATGLTAARGATWVLGSSTADINVTPEYNRAYPLVDVDPDRVNDNMVGTFMPLYPQKYEVRVDLNAMTVTFSPVEPVDGLTSLNMLSDSYKLAGKAEVGPDGKFRYSYHGTAGIRFFFTTAPDRASMAAPAVLNFGAGGHAAPVIQAVEYGKTYSALPITYRRLYTDKTGFFELPGRCDIEFDPSTHLMVVTPYTGRYENYPETLYIKSTTFGTSYTQADGHDGVYTFEYTTQSATSAARGIVFTDAASFAQAGPAAWVLGASDDGSVVEPYPGMKGKLYNVAAADVRDEQKSYFVPFYPHTYTITVDLRDQTVVWGEPVEAPAKLNLLDDRYAVHTAGKSMGNGVYSFETVSYSRHPLFIADAASASELRATPWIFMASPYTGAENTDIVGGTVVDAARSTYYGVHYNAKGFWMTPEEPSRLRGRLDTGNNTIQWEVTPFVPREIEVLYMLDSGLSPLSRAVSDNTGIFEFDVTLRSGAGIAFSDSDSDRNNPDRAFYGSGAPYGAARVTPESGVDYPLVLTSGNAVRDNNATYYLSKGRWRIRIDMNTGRISFADYTRGGEWYTPQTLALCDDDLNVIATAVAREGVFTFEGVAIPAGRDISKVVFLDTADGGSIFGANATGELGPQVESGTGYDLYMPSKLWVVTDGASCFGLAPSSYDITVDFNNRNVVFIDPSIPVYPSRMQLVAPDGESAPLATADGENGVYRFSLRNREPVTFYFYTPGDGVTYGAVEGNVAITTGAVIAMAQSDTPFPVTLPEGLWTVEFSLADMTAKFVETPRPRFVGTTLPAGTPFPGYFGTGTNPRLEFTFNNNLKSVAGIWIVLGDYAGGVPAEGETTALGLRAASIVDNTLVVDCTGQHYAIPDGAEPVVHIVLSKVVDSNNEVLVSDPVEGLPDGSMVFEYPFSEFERIAVDCRFDPEPGSNIDQLDFLAMRVSRFDDITFSNILFTADLPDDSPSTEDVTTLAFPARWERGDTDADGYTEVVVAVPMAVRGLGNVSLRLENLDIDDGYGDHGDDVVAEYETVVDPAVGIEVDPADGSLVSRIDQVTLAWTHPLVTSVGNMVRKAMLTNRATGEVIDLIYAYPDDDRSLLLIPETPVSAPGDYTLEISQGDIVFNDDHDALGKSMSFSFSVREAGLGNLRIAEDDDVEVVNIAGIVVRRGKGRQALDGLTGIYIVNGVKCRLDNGRQVLDNK